MSIFGPALRALRDLAESSGRFSPAEIASLDRSAAAGDDIDVGMLRAEMAMVDARAAMDGLMAALFDGLTEDEAAEIMADPQTAGLWRADAALRHTSERLGLAP